MDSEATKVVFSRIQALDPDNASKIMGFIFIQDPPEKEMLRLASGPETILISLINHAKTHLGISSSASGFSLQAPDGFDSWPAEPIMSPSGRGDPMIFPSNCAKTHVGISSNTSSAPFSRGTNPNNNGFMPSGFSRQVPDQLDLPSADLIMSPSGLSDSMFFGKTNLGISSNTSSAPSPRVIIPNNNSFHVGNPSPSSPWHSGFPFQVTDQLDTPSMISPSGHSDSTIFPLNSANSLHRRSFSVNDAYLGGEEGGFGWRPCAYYSGGFCKNGGNCKFLHGGEDDSDGVVGSPSKTEGFDEMLRMKAIQQQRLSQLMGGGGGGGRGSFPYNKGISFLNDSPRSAAAALMLGEEFYRFGRCRSERSEFSAMGFGVADSNARQIYLTFPADSTFKEEDVSNYFSTFGPVQDVRIPYQQKRMFGFVTFVYPETVKMILAKGNPHFVCDSRVLVKPYKEKGKIPEKRHQLPFERGDFAGCLSPRGLDSRELYDLPIGPRMFLNNQEMVRRKKLELAEFQQALELQGRRLMNLQLAQLKNHHHNHHHHHANQSHPHGSPISSPVQSHLQTDDTFLLRSDNFFHEISEDASNGYAAADSVIAAADEPSELHGGKEVSDNSNTDSNGNEEIFNCKNDYLLESLEHILPDNLFASPTKSASENGSMFSSGLSGADSSSSVPTVPSSRPWQA